MYQKKFPLFPSHLELAHGYWERLLQPGDCVIDATCGNGFDTVFLATMLGKSGMPFHLIAIDKQKSAIKSTQEHLQKNLGNTALTHVHFFEQCHSSFPESVLPESVKLIVYNLGYLPKGDKAVITVASSTIASLNAALQLLQAGGVISVTCYPGHTGGDEEEKAVIEWASKLDSEMWNCTHHARLNKHRAPSLLLIQKRT